MRCRTIGLLVVSLGFGLALPCEASPLPAGSSAGPPLTAGGAVNGPAADPQSPTTPPVIPLTNPTPRTATLPSQPNEKLEIEEISADQKSLQVQSGGRTLTLVVKSPELQSALKRFGKGDQLSSLVYEEVSGQNLLKSLAVKEIRQEPTPRLLALLLSALLLWLLWLMLLGGETPALIKGADNRYSHSKFQIVLWFFVLIATYMAASWFRWRNGGPAFAGGVNIPPNLLLLSGLSALTFAAAKGITQSKIEAGAITKTPAPKPRFPHDLFHDDEGRVDMANFQAVIVAIIAVVVYVVRVYGFLEVVELHRFVDLPDVDTTILATFGLGQGAYLAKKYVGDDGGGQPASARPQPDPAPPPAKTTPERDHDPNPEAR